MSHYIFHQLFYRAITPLHVGCGQDVGVVDLPIIRERTTDLPFLPGSGIRGALRDNFELHENPQVRKLAQTLFGPLNKPEEFAGCVSILDARLVLFPVRSDHQVFLWVTCPFVLTRLAEMSRYFSGKHMPAPPTDLVLNDAEFIGSLAATQVYLEEYPFRKNQAASDNCQWFKEIENDLSTLLSRVRSRLLLISDTAFHHFTRYATMVVQHNTLTSAKTVADQALYSVESAPPETVFCGFWGTTKPRCNDAEAVDSWTELQAGLRYSSQDQAILILGGKESTGLGVTELTFEESKS